jgi:hypothetical protein
MPMLTNPQREAFAQACAQGVPGKEAYRRAGYIGHPDNAAKIAKYKEVSGRTAELVSEKLWGGSPDLGPVINELMRLALAAAKGGTVGGFNAAKGLLAEAAKLKLQLGAQRRERQDPYDDIPPRMSEAEWMKTYAPQA